MVDTRTIGDLLLPREGAVWQDNHTIAISVLSAAILLGLIVTLLCITPGYGYVALHWSHFSKQITAIVLFYRLEAFLIFSIHICPDQKSTVFIGHTSTLQLALPCNEKQ